MGFSYPYAHIKVIKRITATCDGNQYGRKADPPQTIKPWSAQIATSDSLQAVSMASKPHLDLTSDALGYIWY